jgi:hypothetical protein
MEQVPLKRLSISKRLQGVAFQKSFLHIRRRENLKSHDKACLKIQIADYTDNMAKT